MPIAPAFPRIAEEIRDAEEESELNAPRKRGFPRVS
jgi:hypothetical protein